MSDIDNSMLYEDENEDTQANKYLLFDIGDEVFGIAIEQVTEIIELQEITKVPDLPDFIKGVINLRGKIIPAMDLRLRFGMQEREYDDRTCIINVNIRDNLVGFIVDTVKEVQEIPEGNIEAPPEFKSASGHQKYISGLGKIDSEVKILLDVDSILYEKELEEITNKAAKA